MKKIPGDKVDLVPYYREGFHEFFQKYVADEMMSDESYEYVEEDVELRYYYSINEDSIRGFLIKLDEEIIGDILLKNIDWEKKVGELSIALANDDYKNMGYGTEAIILILDYGFMDLALEKIVATTIHRNTRSQYILEKLSFEDCGEDSKFKYYKLEDNVSK